MIREESRESGSLLGAEEARPATLTEAMQEISLFESKREPLGDTSRELRSKIEEVMAGENESLESLAQQREKILGELFGKFKKDK